MTSVKKKKEQPPKEERPEVLEYLSVYQYCIKLYVDHVCKYGSVSKEAVEREVKSLWEVVYLLTSYLLNEYIVVVVMTSGIATTIIITITVLLTFLLP